MLRRALPVLLSALVVFLAGCGTTSTSTAAQQASNPPSPVPSSTPAIATSPAASHIKTPSNRTLLVDTDVAGDDLVALTFLLRSPNVTIAAVTVSGTGEAHCAAGVDVVLRLLDRLAAPEIPVACGRQTPLAGDHAFPDAWRAGVDAGSGLALPATTRTPSSESATALIARAAASEPGLEILTLGPLTNLADALGADASLGPGLGPVVVMGGAIHVPGNFLGPDAPAGNTVAEWNIYVDPKAAQVVVDSHLDLLLVSLDGTSQVPVTRDFVARVRSGATGPGARVLTELFDANPFMTDGSYYLWDPLAAEFAAGYRLGTFSPETIEVEQAEGPDSGFTRPIDGTSNCRYLSSVDAAAAETTLFQVLDAP